MSLLVATGIAGTLCARAADMPALFPQQAYQDAEPPPQVEWGSGWYLRGDLTATDDTVPAMLGTLANAATTHEWDFGAGGGAGYKFNDYFRADVTGDYLGTEKRNGPGFFGGTTTASASIERWAGLVNGYIDIGNWGGLTPYVGGGIGVAGLSSHGSYTTIDGSSYKIGSHDDYQLAWAAMAGVSYHVSPHLLLDIGYRYLDLGTYHGPQGAVVQVGQNSVNFYNSSKTDLTSHEVRVGVRYQID